MDLRVSAFLLPLLTLATTASAGIPEEFIVECPIGGSPVTVLGTLSCSWEAGLRTMSLRVPSTCDFVTRLPVCSKDDFPIYREFSSDEVSRLKGMVLQDWYQSSRVNSEFLRAYLLERELGTYSKAELFWLLQEGFFFDPIDTYGDAEYLSYYKDVAKEYFKEVEGVERKFVLLAEAFAHVHTAKPEEARKLLALAAKIPSPTSPFLDQYIKLVEACIENPAADECHPEHYVEFD